MGLFSKIFGTENDRQIKKLEAIANKIEALADKYASYTDKELNQCTEKFKEELRKGKTLDDILPDAFACVREASSRVLGMRHFHVQLIGGIALHQGRIAEMCTGEGKTLVSTLPAYLNALTGKGVHIVTVNDYLAKRDAEWMGQVHRFLGLTVDVVYNNQPPEEKRKAYKADITYGTNSTFGFDYLRDNQAKTTGQLYQRALNYVIIDEVDSVLIDEARTPLIISGKSTKSSEIFYRTNRFAQTLKAPDPDSENEAEQTGDFEINEEDRKITLTERGTHKAEAFFKVENIADIANIDLYRHIRLAIRANFLMQRDKDYLVKDGQVIIIDEFTGRMMIGRRFNDGLHTAIEAKEGLKIKDENMVVATITYQNLFRLYSKLSGMTGTAKTEEDEFRRIYGLDIVVIPTNKPVVRRDENDKLYTTEQGKYRAIIEDIKDCYDRGQPVLVGTVSVEKSEKLSSLLVRERIRHNVLNAKNHEKEAEIVAQAGKKGMVTIATNMAGRGTDIMLGGNPEFMAKQYLIQQRYSERVIQEATSRSNDVSKEGLKARLVYREKLEEYKKETDKEKQEVIALGGLRIIGTERHESRRIDNQLRGRAGRQGDIGSSVFYLSMEDDLVRIFGGDRMKALSMSLNLPDDVPISLKMMTNKVEDAQKHLEARNYSMRKSVLSFDDVVNRQRELIYSDRRKMLYDKSYYKETYAILDEIIKEVLINTIDFSLDFSRVNYDNLNKILLSRFLKAEDFINYVGTSFLEKKDFENINKDKLIESVSEYIINKYKARIARYRVACSWENFTQAVELSIDLSKPVEEWNYVKLNELVTVKLNDCFEDLFTLNDAIALEDRSVEGIAKVIGKNLESFYSQKLIEYNARILGAFISDYSLSDIAKVKEIYKLSDISSTKFSLSDKEKENYIVNGIRLHNEGVAYDISKQLLDEFTSLFACSVKGSPFEWDFAKVDKELVQALIPKGISGDTFISNVISVNNFNVYAVEKLSVIVSERLRTLYNSIYGEKGNEYLDRIRGDKALEEYVTSLIVSRANSDELCSRWDFARIAEILNYNCMPKQGSNEPLISIEDINKLDKEEFVKKTVQQVLGCYVVRFAGRKKELANRRCAEAIVYPYLEGNGDKLSSLENELEKALYPQICQVDSTPLISDDDTPSNVIDSILERLSLYYDNLIKKVNLHIARSIKSYALRADQSLDEGQLSFLDLNDNSLFELSGDASGIDRIRSLVSKGLYISSFDRIISIAEVASAVCVENLSHINKEISQKLYAKDEEIFKPDSLNAFIEERSKAKSISSSLDLYRNICTERGLSSNILRDKEEREVFFRLIKEKVSLELSPLKGAFSSWSYGMISLSLSNLLYYGSAMKDIYAIFTPSRVGENLLEGLSDKVRSTLVPIFDKLIEEGDKKDYTSAHAHIKKMLPEVVAGIVMDYVDYNDDYSCWNYDYINESLAEKLLPKGLDDEKAYQLVTKDVAAHENIDDVIDHVIDIVIASYDRKAIEYNLELLDGRIKDVVKSCINRREHYSEWDYEDINNRLSSAFLTRADRDKKVLSEEFMCDYLKEEDSDDYEEEDYSYSDEGISDSLYSFDSESNSKLSFTVIIDAVKEGLARIMVEKVDDYNRLTENICRRYLIDGVMFSLFERLTMLKYTDEHWYEQIDNMDKLRQGIGLRSLGQLDPITCYQKEGFTMFDEMVTLVREDVVLHALKDLPEELFGKKQESVSDKFGKKKQSNVYYKRVGAQPVRKVNKVGPNDPCPCGSGKKYKKCCGRKANGTPYGVDSTSFDD